MVEDAIKPAVYKNSIESPDNSPPYFEIKRHADWTQISEKALDSLTQGKAAHPEKGAEFGSCLPLGEEYEKKKQKLQEELRLDYKSYLAEKGLKVETPPQPQNLSLPIKERSSAKERLRDERNKEYNHFLKEKAGLKRIEKQTPSQGQTSDAFSPTSPPPVPEALTHKEHRPSRKDASTLTEAQRARGARRGTWGTEGKKRRLRDLHRAKELLEPCERRHGEGSSVELSSEEELRTDQEEFLEFIRGRRQDRGRQEPKNMKGKERRTKQLRDDRPPIIRALGDTYELKGVHYPVIPDLNRKSQSATLKPNLQTSDTMTAERSRSAANKDKAQFATGLMIGTVEENTACQMRKERYRLELLQQMAEQQTNKIREKNLELRVAATGVVDPEKKPDRIKLLGAVNREYEPRRRDVPFRPGRGIGEALENDSSRRPYQDYKPSVNADRRGPTEYPNVAFSSPTMLNYCPAPAHPAARTVSGLGMGVPGMSTFNEDYHRHLSNTLGDIITPRLAGIPPPVAPALSHAYKTPYDDIYQYYGARNPLDPNLHNYGSAVWRGQQLSFLPNMPQGDLRLGAEDNREAMYRHAAPQIATTVLPEQRPKQSHDNYHEELRQQVREMQERKHTERAEKERENARFHAEMLAYEPWGRGGAGAPITDQSGNVVCDLKLMHKTNEKVVMNPELGEKREGQGEIPEMPGSSYIQTTPFALGKVFQDQPSSQQRHRQESYRDFLQQQMEEKRQKQADEKERTRLEEEKEEKMLAKQRAYLQQERDEERERFFRKEEKTLEAKKRVAQQAEERYRNEERKKKEANEREQQLLQQQAEGTRQQNQEQRGVSPPVPALLRKLPKTWRENPGDETPRHPGKPLAPRLPSADSRYTSRTSSVRSMSASTFQSKSPPTPARQNQLRAKEEHQGLMGQLSALRRHLQMEQKRLANQLGRANGEEPNAPITRRRGPLKGDAFDLARLHAARAATRRGQSDSEHVNMKNIQQFNQLKYRDSPSRQEVRQAFPDPPKDELSLDLQQQALLRDQHRLIRSMRRGNDPDDLDSQRPHRSAAYSLTGHSHRGPVLVSESTFIGYHGGDIAPEAGDKQRTPPEDRRTTTPAWWREHLPEVDRPAVQRDENSRADTRSEGSVNLERIRARNEERIRRLNQEQASEGPSGDEEDSLSLRSTPSISRRRVSVDTVATEPWLRPGTSEAVKRPSRRERPPSGDPTH